MKLDLEVPADIEQRVAQAILNSLLGDTIKKTLNELAEETVKNRYSSPVAMAIRGMAQEIIGEMLKTPENKEQIRQAVLISLKDESFLRELVRAAFRD